MEKTLVFNLKFPLKPTDKSNKTFLGLNLKLKLLDILVLDLHANSCIPSQRNQAQIYLAITLLVLTEVRDRFSRTNKIFFVWLWRRRHRLRV